MVSCRFLAGSCAFLFALAWSARVQASGGFDLGGVYVPVGLNTGAALRSEGASGYLLGGEASMLRFWHSDLAFAGGYVDYLRDFGVRTHRLSIGPEVGWMFAGVDAGPVLELGGGRTDFGGRVRVFGSLGFFTIYAGELYCGTRAQARWTTEVGALLKFPIPVASCGTGPCRWGEW